MLKINFNKPLQVEAVYIKGQPDPIKNCAVFILDRFVVIEADPEGTSPIWYNVNLVEKLEGVTAETYKSKVGAY